MVSLRLKNLTKIYLYSFYWPTGQLYSLLSVCVRVSLWPFFTFATDTHEYTDRFRSLRLKNQDLLLCFIGRQATPRFVCVRPCESVAILYFCHGHTRTTRTGLGVSLRLKNLTRIYLLCLYLADRPTS